MVYLDVNHALAPAAVAALPSLAQVYRAMCFPPGLELRTPGSRGTLHIPSLWATHQTLPCCQLCTCWVHGHGQVAFPDPHCPF